jgi:sec-independent protein translocase protein TatB
MFDIGFWELALIGVVALIVIGPDRLPGVARNVGMWIGRARRFVSAVQLDINREMSKAEELKRLLEEQKKIVEQHEIIEELKSSVSATGKPLKPEAPVETMPLSAPEKERETHKPHEQKE